MANLLQDVVIAVHSHNETTSPATARLMMLPSSSLDPVSINVMYSDAATIFAATCACLFSFVGVLGNMITIAALALNPSLRGHATTAFVLSLCVSDLLFCSFSLPVTAVRYINKAWTMGDTLCKMFPVIFYANVAYSLLSMVCITLNRYILIAYNSYYNRLYRPASILGQLLCIWLFAFGLMLPAALGMWGQTGLDPATFSCTILPKNGHSCKRFLFVIGFLLPCCVIICSYSCIYWTVRRQRLRLQQHQRAPAHSQSSGSFQAAGKKTSGTTTTTTAPPSADANRRSREDTRLTTMMLTIFLCFLACFLPLTIVNLAGEKSVHPWLQVVASVLAWASSVVNPFVYAVSNRTYRVAYWRLFARLRCWDAPMMVFTSSKSYQAANGGAGGGGGVGGSGSREHSGGGGLQHQQSGSYQTTGMSNRLMAMAGATENKATGNASGEGIGCLNGAMMR